MNKRFVAAKRQFFREYFQPSRIVLLVVKDKHSARVNVTTLCFVMHAAYKPTSVAFALEKRHLSYDLLRDQRKCVLAVPGRELAEQALICGTKSGREVDKGSLPGMPLTAGSARDFIWIGPANANIELEITGRVGNGDHDLFLAKVINYYICKAACGPNLLSIGRNHNGFELLAHSGMHRIGIPIGASAGVRT